MYSLTEAEFRIKAEPFLRQVFVNDDAFDQPFSKRVVGRLIMYPCEYCIEPPIINAIIDAAANLGDTGCYISLYNTSTSSVEPNHCYIPLEDFIEAYTMSGGLERSIDFRLSMNPYGLDSIIYSASGKWGLITSHERHGLLGGPVEFIEEIRSAVPDLDRQVYGFLGRLRMLLEACQIFPADVTRNKWLQPLLIHVYGEEKAEQILLEAKENPTTIYD
ncbi:hypothetical protein [Microcoleus sp. FACHB-672]|uniref:hypothetical protein n=1 Tax=Microcoleus sp. FACHB-672 TaxID=2692825 RepID=UPI001684CDD2|nr:hypothetical protein [Microcoleus sp. FACHB-672]MBD2044012.1 hypothetical protein [Microcoleus sp. FACHB-672]